MDEQSGGANSCRANAKYACNFGNIKSGKCPGYLVASRNGAAKSDKGDVPRPRVVKGKPKYFMRWNGQRPRGTSNYWQAGEKGDNLVEGDGSKLQEWNDQRCIPRDSDGDILDSANGQDANYLCRVYDPNGAREQKGCVATEKNGTVVGNYRKGQKRGSPYQRKRATHRTRSPSPRRPRSRSPSPRARSRSRSRSPTIGFSPLHSDADEGRPEDPVEQNLAKKGWTLSSHMYVHDDLKLEKTNKGVSVWSAKRLAKGFEIPYLGDIMAAKDVDARTDDRNTYVVNAKHNNKTIFVDGHPKKSKAPISIASYINEPAANEQANAVLKDHKIYPAVIKLTKAIPANTEILVCYGGDYPRNYDTSCKTQQQQTITPRPSALAMPRFNSNTDDDDDADARRSRSRSPLGGDDEWLRNFDYNSDELAKIFDQGVMADLPDSIEWASLEDVAQHQKENPVQYPLTVAVLQQNERNRASPERLVAALSSPAVVLENNDLHTQGFRVVKYEGGAAAIAKIQSSILMMMKRYHGYIADGEKDDDVPNYVSAIFDNSVGGAKDPNRLQMDLTTPANPSTIVADRLPGGRSAATTIRDIISQLQRMYPQLKPHDCSVLFSAAGGGIQAAHADYPTKAFKSIRDENNVPLSVLIGLQNDTVIDLWPGAIEGGKHCEDVVPVRLHYNAGDMVIFRGDLTHAGAPFDHNNVRLHVYLDHPSVKRPSDHTEKHNACTQRKNIEHIRM